MLLPSVQRVIARARPGYFKQKLNLFTFFLFSFFRFFYITQKFAEASHTPTTNTMAASILFNNPDAYADVRLRLEDGSFLHVHRAVICPQSEFLAARFTPEWDISDEVTLEGPPDVVTAVFRYMYHHDLRKELDHLKRQRDTADVSDEHTFTTRFLLDTHAVADRIVADALVAECTRELTATLNRSRVGVVREQAKKTPGCRAIVDLCDEWTQDNRTIPTTLELRELYRAAVGGATGAQLSCSMLFNHMAGTGHGKVVEDLLRETLREHKWFTSRRDDHRLYCGASEASKWLFGEAFTHVDTVEVLMQYRTVLKETPFLDKLVAQRTVKQHLDELYGDCKSSMGDMSRINAILKLFAHHLLSTIKADPSSVGPDIFMDMLPLLLIPSPVTLIDERGRKSVFFEPNLFLDILGSLPAAYLPFVCLKLGQTKVETPTKVYMLRKLNEAMLTDEKGKCTWA
jgi:hypothetical protein